MELKLNDGFCEMTQIEMQMVDGGDIVEPFLEFVGDIYDSWCDMWYDAGKNLARWIKGEV